VLAGKKTQKFIKIGACPPFLKVPSEHCSKKATSKLAMEISLWTLSIE